MQATQCLFYRSLQERRDGLESFKPSLKQGEIEEDREEKKEDDDDEDEMKGKRRDDNDMHNGGGHDSQNSPWSLLPLLQFLLQGSLQQEEVKQPHCRYTQRPNIKNLVTLQAPNHLPLAPLPCLPEQCNHCGKIVSRKSSRSKHILIVHGDSLPQKILHDRYPAKLMALRRINFVSFVHAYI